MVHRLVCRVVGGGALYSLHGIAYCPLTGFRSLEFDMASLHPITWWVVDDELLRFAWWNGNFASILSSIDFYFS